MKQPRRMEVHVEQVTFEDCKSAADMLCGTDELDCEPNREIMDPTPC